MARGSILGTLSVACGLLLVLSGLSMFVGADKDEEKVRVIVLFKDKVDTKLVEDKNGEILQSFSIVAAVVTELSAQAIKDLRKSDKVRSVDEDSEGAIMGEVDAQGKPGAGPSKEKLDWGVNRIDADQAWATSTGLGVKVAVIDTGIDKDHPDLEAVIKGGTNFVPNRKGVVDPAAWDDDNGHGTHCSGIIAAQHNSIGVKGVAPAVGLYGVKVLDSGGRGTSSNAALGIEWAIANGMDVLSMSIGWYDPQPVIEAACAAAHSEGIVIVAAAGNSGKQSMVYPAAYDDHVIAVSATDSLDALASFSSFGAAVDISAPGVSIYSTYKGGRYATMSGTSMACPHVAGTVALILEENPSYTPAEVETLLASSSEDLGDPGWDMKFGYGLVDACEAVGG